MKKPKHAVLDGDLLVWRAAYWADKEGIEDLEPRLLNDVKLWTPKGCIDGVCIALSCSSAANFRKNAWSKYKLNRVAVTKPTCLPDAYDILSNIPGTCVLKEPTLEADDLIGMATSGGHSIGVSLDKDLVGTPGWHFNPAKQSEPALVSVEEADAFFLQQWVSGDSTDNIWGLWKCGPAKGKALIKGKTYEEACAAILQAYEDEDWARRPAEKTPHGLTRREFAISQARAVRILRDGDYDKDTGVVALWQPPVTVLLEANTEIL